MLVSLGPSDLQRLAQIVREETGNQVQEKNFAMLESRLRSHILRLHFVSMTDYWAYFEANEAQEREALKSLMTTHYTFFFREYVHFEVLETWIQNNLAHLKKRFETEKKPLRVWSAACSRGQEVYSLAMFLEVNLFQKYGIGYEVCGTDIDAESVKFAKNGVYPISEVNTIPRHFLNGCWKRGTGAVKEFAAVHPNLKAKTQFDVANLLELHKWNPKAKYDVVFCRNVFIYFSEQNVRKIALDLRDRLEPSGLLVSGASEPLRFDGWDLESAGPSCYLNATATAPSAAAAPASTSTKRAEAKPVAVVPSRAKYRVLCVDDSATIQVLIKKIFSGDPECEGVDIAVNGRDAREKLNLRKYQLITLDIHMPEVNGIEFLEGHYDKKTDPPVIMISSVNRTDVQLATRAIQLGAFDYVEKPAMNNLVKSSEEILTKARMALRARDTKQETDSASSFDASIAQQIVVPDASQCLRVVLADFDSKFQLEQIIKGQSGEFRSPATLLILRDQPECENFESKVLEWTRRSVVTLRPGQTQMLKPNMIYLTKSVEATEVLSAIRFKTISLQVLADLQVDLGKLREAPTLQILLDERVGSTRGSFESRHGFKISDLTPATSFPSLSVEFFASLRKAAA